jgi:hypothetical protein
MRGISCVVSPIRDHTFFKQTQFQRLLGNGLFQLTRFAAKGCHLARRSRTSSITGKPALTSFQELLRLFVINALGNAFAAARFGDGFFTTQPVQHNADLVFG